MERWEEMKIQMIIAPMFIGVLLVISSCSHTLNTSSPQTPNNPASKNQPSGPPPPVTVMIVFDFSGAEFQGLDAYKGEFKTQVIKIPVGTTVTWENDETYLGNKHNVTSKNGLFDKDLNVGESFNYTFTKPGTFDYYCKYFPAMTGEIIVN
jgi:hypothetical protein